MKAKSFMPAPNNPQLAVLRQWVEKAEHYAVVVRYPQAGLAIPLRESRRAVTIARRLRREVRRSLPRPAVRRTK